MSDWTVYIIRCSDDSYYTGITTDVERRFEQHLSGKGAKYFYGRSPVEVVYTEYCENRSLASRREAQIKGLDRAQKIRLFSLPS
ncbi:GIY-YIG nuclease family protein [Thiolapillus sp.]|uniref:GIY-YIG nuclease family protein n=1 Tax=Thiolapillus brandeum TaxID=1076588 RepID=A0A831WAW8_9GAMM|nr:GIY-YIG nuclease family protein [Thiolapillus sp.]HEC05660.1 GIY-YIG nuclease family protein [Thiolapillus brandeum]